MTQNRKRGRPWKREAARLAANAIREGRFNDVTKAACAYFAQHIGRTASREMPFDEIKNGRQIETFKDFCRYIIEELNNEPKINACPSRFKQAQQKEGRTAEDSGGKASEAVSTHQGNFGNPRTKPEAGNGRIAHLPIAEGASRFVPPLTYAMIWIAKPCSE